MQKNNKITYPESEKVYMPGKIYPIQVGMRKIKQLDTIELKNGERIVSPNKSIIIYDTSGPYSDPSMHIDLKMGLPRMRESWIKNRGDVEQLSEISSSYGKLRASDSSIGCNTVCSNLSSFKGKRKVKTLLKCFMPGKV